MLGAIAGDIIGSIHEFGPVPPADTPLFGPGNHFTDDTVLTLATARTLLGDVDYATAYREGYEAHPDQAWGLRFMKWAREPDRGPYESFGNGSAMRVSPIGFWALGRDEAIEEAERSAEVTHNHAEGIRGAQATADAIWLARQGLTGDAILEQIRFEYGYDLDESVAELQQTARYNEICQGTVPPAIRIACEAEDFEHAMRLALSLDADTDTLACIVGGIAEARFGVPEWIATASRSRLSDDQRALLDRFQVAVQARQ